MSRTKNGFTLIEMVIVASLLSLVGVIATGFLIASLKSSSKAEVTKEVRQNGAYALSTMTVMIRSAIGLISVTPGAISIKNNDGGQTIFRCQENRIASASGEKIAFLTGSSVLVSDCLFAGRTNPGQSPSVQIRFTVSQKGIVKNLNPSEKSTQSFSTDVSLRNY